MIPQQPYEAFLQKTTNVLYLKTTYPVDSAFVNYALCSLPFSNVCIRNQKSRSDIFIAYMAWFRADIFIASTLFTLKIPIILASTSAMMNNIFAMVFIVYKLSDNKRRSYAVGFTLVWWDIFNHRNVDSVSCSITFVSILRSQAPWSSTNKVKLRTGCNIPCLSLFVTRSAIPNEM